MAVKRALEQTQAKVQPTQGGELSTGKYIHYPQWKGGNNIFQLKVIYM